MYLRNVLIMAVFWITEALPMVIFLNLFQNSECANVVIDHGCFLD